MPLDFAPMEGAQGWQLSNPPILSTAPLLASLDVFRRATLPRLREKSISLTGYLERLVRGLLPGLIEIITPAAPEQRGCQLSLRIDKPAHEARRAFERLGAAGVIADWREPDVLRLAPTPLYNSYSDVFNAVDALTRIVRP